MGNVFFLIHYFAKRTSSCLSVTPLSVVYQLEGESSGDKCTEEVGGGIFPLSMF